MSRRLTARLTAAPVQTPAYTPVRPAAPARERPQGLFSGAAEKAAAAAPAPAAPAQEPKAPAAEEDPFDSIFKIFNTK